MARWLPLRLRHEGRDHSSVSLEEWIAPTLAGTWVNEATAGDNVAGYWKDPFGVVHLRGVIAGGAIAFPSTAFTLAKGYRPAAVETFGVLRSGILLSRVHVLTTGEVQEIAGRTATAHFLTLDGLTFRAAPAG